MLPALIALLPIAGFVLSGAHLAIDTPRFVHDHSPHNAITIAADACGLIPGAGLACLPLGAAGWMSKHPCINCATNRDVLGRGGRRP